VEEMGWELNLPAINNYLSDRKVYSMNRAAKYFNYFLITFELFFCLGGFIGFHVAFGEGLGDLFPYALLYILTTTHIVLTILIYRNKVKRETLPMLVFFYTIIMIIFSLRGTIYRGHEYPWNGKIFYKNEEESKVISVPMN
jgi:hypothetical protein